MLLSLLLLLLLAVSLPADARLFRLYCPLQEETVVQVYRDGDRFYFAGNEENGNTNNVRHALEEANWSSLRGGGGNENWSSALTIEAARQAQEDVSNLETSSVRKCACAWGRNYEGTDYYCTLPWTHCAIPSSNGNNNLTPACLNATKSNKTAKFLWYPVIVMYSLLILCLLCTQTGRGVPNYAMGKVVPYWNYRQINQIIEHDPGRRNRLIRDYCQRRRREMQRRAEQEGAAGGTAAANPAQDVPVRQEEEAEEEQLPPPMFLALRTRRYDASKETKVLEHAAEHDSDLGDEATCAICFGPLTDGCRVGALPCDHIFHVECLKIWLKRRNVCPLCQTRHAAEPRYDNDEQKPETPNGGETSATPGENDGSGRRDEQEDDSEGCVETPPSPLEGTEGTTINANATEQLSGLFGGRTVRAAASALGGSSHHEHAE